MDRPHYARLDDVKAGDVLVAGAELDCIGVGTHLSIHADSSGGLYVPCRDGRHVLAMHTDDDGLIVGLYREG